MRQGQPAVAAYSEPAAPAAALHGEVGRQARPRTCGEGKPQVLCAVGQPAQDAQRPPVRGQRIPAAAVTAICSAHQQAQQIPDLGCQLPLLCRDGPVQSCLKLVQVSQGGKLLKHRVGLLVAAWLLLRVAAVCCCMDEHRAAWTRLLAVLRRQGAGRRPTALLLMGRGGVLPALCGRQYA